MSGRKASLHEWASPSSGCIIW
ncbi:ORFL223W.iORF1 [Human betaherpesvirus 5]|nr:ORFL223W.iORF1 [Human betaherpesvirus 5]QHX40586.1 ORFL223W.iORF1 [Human betaherpesvirus 5]